jgi:hypothetical protein
MMAGLRWGAGSPSSDDDAEHPHYQQQHSEHDVEHGLGFGLGLLRLPSSRASSGRSLSFLLQQRHTPSIPEEPGLQGWEAAAGKDAAAAAAVRGPSDAGARGADVRSSTSSGAGWGWGLGGLFAAAGSRNSSKARLWQTLRSQSAIVSRSSSSGYDSVGAALPVGTSTSSSASHANAQASKFPAAADVSIPLAVLGQQHQAAVLAAGSDNAAAAAAAGPAAGTFSSRVVGLKGVAGGDDQRSDVRGQQEAGSR